MNQKAEVYWKEFWKDKKQPKLYGAWSFGFDPDGLAQLVVDGIKTATCSAHVFYDYDNEELPAIGNYSIILNSKDDPVAIIKTIDVQIIPFNEVSEEFAWAEGEGDRSYQYWYEAHVKFFKAEFDEAKMEFSEDILVVCERFELVDVIK